jgi:hypothetical protein
MHSADTPLLAIAIATIALSTLYLVWRQFRSMMQGSIVENAHYHVLPAPHTYTPSELAMYDGEEGRAILIALAGKVYDMT